MAEPAPVALRDQLAVFERDIKSNFHRPETRIQNLESKNPGNRESGLGASREKINNL
jgi:hypothetical protein